MPTKRQRHGLTAVTAEMESGLRVTGHRVSNLGPGRIGSRVKALTRLFDPDSCSML